MRFYFLFLIAFAEMVCGFTSLVSVKQENSPLVLRMVTCDNDKKTSHGRRKMLLSTIAGITFLPTIASASKTCTDIESCRELGERKISRAEKENPVAVLPSGVRSKRLRPPVGAETVQEGSTVELAYSINANGGYLYSQGMGYEKIPTGQNDMGLDSIRVVVGKHDVPEGIEQVLVGMRRGERRRIELPPHVGFETSNWNPAPNNAIAKQRLDAYKRLLEGGPNSPPFPAVSIWDVEVLKVKS